MSGISTAIGSERVSRVAGYKILKGNFSNTTPNLPQQIVILAEANNANQIGLVPDAWEATSAAAAGQRYGYGSPIHQIMRILRPAGSDGIGGIPTIVMPQVQADGATATIIVWHVTGIATANITHKLFINGRNSVDFKTYSYSVVIGDTAVQIAAKAAAAITAVLGSPAFGVGSATAGTFGTSSVAFSATSLTAGQTITLAGLTYTSTGTTTQAQLAAAFASLAVGATTGAGTGTGTYSGTLTGFATGTVTSNTVIFTATTVGPAPAGYPVVKTGNGAAPVITSVAGTYPVGILTITSKWLGITSSNLNLNIDTNGNLAGITYAQISDTAGAGDADISDALAQFEDTWYTSVINSYGIDVPGSLDLLEEFNGAPDPTSPTGRYSATVFKPFMAFFGDTAHVIDDLVDITDDTPRISQLTNVLCPAPYCLNFPWEIAANAVLRFCRIMQDTPHLTVAGQSYPDVIIPTNNLIGDMSDYENRDLLKSKGCSTVMLVNGQYQVQDFVTTYHPDGEVPLIFNEARYLNLDWNIRDGYRILENANVKDKVIVADGQYTIVSNVIRPSDWKAILFTYIDYLAQIALINNPKFSKDSLVVQIDPDNPNRFNTTFRYKRTGTSEIESTDVTVGF